MLNVVSLKKVDGIDRTFMEATLNSYRLHKVQIEKDYENYARKTLNCFSLKCDLISSFSLQSKWALLDQSLLGLSSAKC